LCGGGVELAAEIDAPDVVEKFGQQPMGAARLILCVGEQDLA
jgi:hypothetical protein